MRSNSSKDGGSSTKSIAKCNSFESTAGSLPCKHQCFALRSVRSTPPCFLKWMVRRQDLWPGAWQVICQPITSSLRFGCHTFVNRTPAHLKDMPVSLAPRSSGTAGPSAAADFDDVESELEVDDEEFESDESEAAGSSNACKGVAAEFCDFWLVEEPSLLSDADEEELSLCFFLLATGPPAPFSFRTRLFSLAAASAAAQRPPKSKSPSSRNRRDIQFKRNHVRERLFRSDDTMVRLTLISRLTMVGNG